MKFFRQFFAFLLYSDPIRNNKNKVFLSHEITCITVPLCLKKVINNSWKDQSPRDYNLHSSYSCFLLIDITSCGPNIMVF